MAFDQSSSTNIQQSLSRLDEDTMAKIFTFWQMNQKDLDRDLNQQREKFQQFINQLSEEELTELIFWVVEKDLK